MSTHDIGEIAVANEEARSLEAVVEGAAEVFRQRLRASLIAHHAQADSAPGLLELELAIHQAGREACDHATATILEAVLCQPALRERAMERVRCRPEDFRDVGLRSTPIRLLGGGILRVTTLYLVRDRRGKPGRKRKAGQRGPAGGGWHPMLAALGIVAGATPALASRVARQSAQSSSLAEARADLAVQGLDLNVKSVRRIGRALAQKALELRHARLDLAALQMLQRTPELAGKRVVVGLDGGRLRTRVERRRGRRRARTGRRGYGTPWREPKVMAVYEVDAAGKKTSRPPIYEATMEPWEQAFELFAVTLARYGAGAALELILVSDGAHTIRDGLDGLIQRLGISPARVVKVVDYYHAVEKIYEAADLCRAWSARRRSRWAKRLERDLKSGRQDAVIQALLDLCRGRRGKAMHTIAQYFEGNRDRMRYRWLRRHKILIGSGMVESTIRRVVNLRLKGPGIFWRVENAERMLALRAALKSGRWEEFVQDALAGLTCRVQIKIGPRDSGKHHIRKEVA